MFSSSRFHRRLVGYPIYGIHFVDGRQDQALGKQERMHPRIQEPQDAAIETIAFDEEGVTRTMRDGRVEQICWDDLERIEIVTTDQGPFADDVFWLLVGDKGGCVAPSEAEGTPALVDRLFALPGFDYGKVIEAMSSCENSRFLVWKQTA